MRLLFCGRDCKLRHSTFGSRQIAHCGADLASNYLTSRIRYYANAVTMVLGRKTICLMKEAHFQGLFFSTSRAERLPMMTDVSRGLV